MCRLWKDEVEEGVCALKHHFFFTGIANVNVLKSGFLHILWSKMASSDGGHSVGVAKMLQNYDGANT